MPEPLIDRKFLEKLERLTIHWQKSFPGLVGGHNASRFSGSGQEFLDHRHFHHGDDLRAVNWRAYLRLEKLILKMFSVEPRIPVRILLDASSSMSTGNPSKFDHARRLAAALVYVGLVRLETMLIQPFRQGLGDACTFAGGRHRFAPAVDYLTKMTPDGTTDFLRVSKEFIGTYPQRGLVIIISDFLDDNECERPLQYLADFGHELLLVHLWAEEDRNPPWTGQLELIDAESGMKMELDFDDQARQNYNDAFDEHMRAIRQIALRKGGRFISLPTSAPVEAAIFGPMIEAGAVVE